METPTHDQTSSSPRSGNRIRGTLLAAGAALGMTLAGLAVAAAQTDEAPPSSQPGAESAPAEEAPEARRGGRGGRDHKQLGMGGIHGEFTTRAPAGGYQVVASQKGEVTAVNASSITVRSEDGFSRTYSVDDRTLVNAGNDGIGDVATGDQVRVMAIVEDGGRARAVDVRDGTKIRASREQWVPRPERPAAAGNEEGEAS